jgi:hypothetical protein
MRRTRIRLLYAGRMAALWEDLVELNVPCWPIARIRLLTEAEFAQWLRDPRFTLAAGGRAKLVRALAPALRSIC